ncbi:MAG: quinol:electron acceptor oxidoreductase subunit ActD [Candidatus Eisenbacteria bacterium]
MTRRWEFTDEAAFLEKLAERVEAGVPPQRLTVVTPVPVPHAERWLRVRPSRLRYFTLAGGLAGLAAGFAFPILTALDWPLITGGKPIVSIPPFVIIAFALTILLGALASLFGFLHLTRLPSPGMILAPLENENHFVIVEADGEARAQATGGEGTS